MIERVLPNEMTETEFFNAKRVEMGLKPITGHVTKIRPGLHTACGCEITEVAYGVGFIVERRGECDYHRGQHYFVRCDEHGQAVASIVEDGWEGVGVMRLDRPFPHGV